MKYSEKKYHIILIMGVLALATIVPNCSFSANLLPNDISTNTSFTIVPSDTSKKAPTQKKKHLGKKKEVSFETFGDCYERALKLYNKESWLSAAGLLESLYPLSFGTKYADSILFMFADCYFQNKDYQLAAYHFKDYAHKYTGTERTELALYKCVKSIYNITPNYNVDQSDTQLAIDEINQFIQTYPKSKYIEECNTMLDELREVLAKKDFEVIRLYYNTEHYEAVQISTRNFLKSFSYSTFAPESIYILVKSNYEFAKKSIESKKKERFMACIDAYEMLKNQYPTSIYLPEAQKLADESSKQIKDK